MMMNKINLMMNKIKINLMMSKIKINLMMNKIKINLMTMNKIKIVLLASSMMIIQTLKNHKITTAQTIKSGTNAEQLAHCSAAKTDLNGAHTTVSSAVLAQTTCG